MRSSRKDVCATGGGEGGGWVVAVVVGSVGGGWERGKKLDENKGEEDER